MINLMDFMKLIEALRKRRHLSIQELTDGVMSIKTYYRYKNNKTRISATKTNQLLNKINAEYTDLLYYFIRYFNSEVDLEVYIMALIQGNHEFVDIAREKLKNRFTDTADRDQCIDALYQKYQNFFGIIDNDKYQNYIESRLANTRKDNANLYTLFCNVLYQMDSKTFDEDLATYLLQEYRDVRHAKQRMPLYLISAHYLLRDLMLMGYKDLSEYKKTLDVYSEIGKFFESKKAVDISNLYYAYYYFKTGNNDAYEEHLFRYLNFLNFTFNFSDLERYLKYVREVFQVEPLQFMKNYFLKKSKGFHR